jgi:hypothetical protein
MIAGLNDRGTRLDVHETCLARLAWLIILMAPFVAGCSSGDVPETAPASGVVMMQGKPLAHVGVTLFPPKGPIASGNTNEQGEFTLSTSSPGDGAPIGLNKVTIGAAEEGPPKPGAPKIPDRYGRPDTSGLTAEVKPGEKNVFTFELMP